MRLSRPRVLLRIALLVVGGAYMLVRAVDLLRVGRSGDPRAATLAERLGLVWGLMGLLALLTAASAAWSLRRRPPKKTLHLDDLPPRRSSSPDDGPTGGDGS